MNKSVTLIPARKRMGSTEQEEEKPKLKVAAYCRVSTDSDEQATSYETQVEHYTSFIKKKSRLGNLPAYSLMMGSAAVIPKTGMSSTE